MIIRPCRACGKRIAFLESANGNSLVPCDIISVREGDKVFDSSKHTSHFKTCSDPRRFSKNGPLADQKSAPKPEQGKLL